MLLSCCFREPKNKKHKKRKNAKDDFGLPVKEDQGGDSARLIDGPPEDVGVYTVYSGHQEGPGGYTVHGATARPPSSQAGSSLDLKLHQERHPPSKEARRLLKQKSQESLKSNRSVRSRSIQGASTIPYIDQSPVNDQPVPDTLPLGDQRRPSRPSPQGDQGRRSPPSPPNRRKESLPSPPTTPREARRPLSQQGPEPSPPVEVAVLQKHSTDLEPPTSSPTPPLDPSTGCHGSSYSKRYSTPSRLSSPSKSWTDSQSSISRLEEAAPILTRGLQRSTAFHDGSLLEEQVRRDEDLQRKQLEIEELQRKQEEMKELQKKQVEMEELQKKQVEREAELVKRLRLEHDAMIEIERKEHREQMELEEKKYQIRLLEEEETHKKKLENAVMNAKNDANATISQLNRQIVTERAKLVTEQQQNSQNLMEEFRLKEERLNSSVRQTEERELAWQQEKAEVLQEVQRLKAEASKMVAILAMETEEEQLSEERKRSLTAEVYSLQLVVEMRTGEVRNLREQLARSTRDLEGLEVTKEKLKKAEARLDDLKEQVVLKDRLEKQLSEEKSQLERTVCSSSKAVERMSQNVEELQWRIRNNFDLPITHHTCREMGQPASLPDFPTSTESPLTRPRPQSTPILNQSGSGQVRKNSLFSVSREMMEATSSVIREQEVQDLEDVGATSDFSPSSDTGGPEGLTGEGGRYPEEIVSKCDEELTTGEEEEKEDEKDDLHSDIGDAEIDSLDEGLGDISSENETVDSPTPDLGEANVSLEEQDSVSEVVVKSMPSPPSINTSNTNSPERRKFLELQLTSQPPSLAPSLPGTEPPPTSPLKSPMKERIPSRIAFETPL